jgi:hypothetical protein
MTPIDRRRHLKTRPNPDARLDYVAGLAGAVQAFGHGKPTRVVIHYVPDRAIVEPAAFGRYLEALAAAEWGSLEELATAILGDFADALVARWTRVAATSPEGAYPGVGSHQVTIEDRQPGWDNPGLLSRLPGA